MLPNHTQAVNLHSRIIAIIENGPSKPQTKKPKMEEIDEVRIYLNFVEHKFQIDARINDTLRERILSFLSQNHDFFAWSYEDMMGIDLEVAVNHLQVDPDY